MIGSPERPKSSIAETVSTHVKDLKSGKDLVVDISDKDIAAPDLRRLLGDRVGPMCANLGSDMNVPGQEIPTNIDKKSARTAFLRSKSDLGWVGSDAEAEKSTYGNN